MINLIKQSIPSTFMSLLILIVFFVLIKYLYGRFIRKFILIYLFKKRKITIYRLLFHRFNKLERPILYLIGLYLLKVTIELFAINEEISFIFYIGFLFLIAWSFYEIIKFLIYVTLSVNIAKDKEIHQELFVLFLNVIKVLIALIIIFAVLARIGVDLTGLATSLGIGGIVLGLSAKDTLTNFFDSIRLIGENAFHIGDWIETSEIEGVVTEIGLAATCIRTFDNALVTVPNSKLAGDYIKNWSKRKVGRQIKFKLRLHYTYDMVEVEHVIDEIRTMLNEHNDIMNDKKTKYLMKMKKTYKDGIFQLSNNPSSSVGSKLLVYLDEIDDYSMNILVYAFSISVNWEEWLSVKQDILKKVIIIIDNSKLELALPKEEILLDNKQI